MTPSTRSWWSSFNELMANCAIYSTALDITDAANALAAEGHPIDHDDLATITPYITHTIRRLGGLRGAAISGATANLNSWTEEKVDTKNPNRGPLLIISGEKDNTVCLAIAYAPSRSSSAKVRLQRSSRS
jgi:Tn3 transposase DDE domain